MAVLDIRCLYHVKNNLIYRSHGGVEGQTRRWSWLRNKSAFTGRHGRCTMHVDLELTRDLNNRLALGKYHRSISVGFQGQ